MNFFDRQRDLRRMSVRLVLLFAIAVVGIIVTVDLAVLIALNAFGTSSPARLWGIVGVVSLATAGGIAVATLYRMATLRGGGGRVARELGGDYVPEDTTDPQLRRLRNVVEEIAIASGVPVPEIYVLQNEGSINAFAAGWSTSDAAIAVTRGALERLNRDELQGVIAHEFSHVVNGDMRLNIRLMGLLFGILFLAVMGETILRAGAFTRSRDGKGGANPLPLIGIALLVAGYIGVLIGRIIKASVSRKREYLADASAVQFTRQTAGLAGALKKIAGLPAGSTLAAPKNEEVAHMLFAAGKLRELFATHPPLPDRIKALDPTFDPAQLQVLAQRWARTPPMGLEEDRTLGLAEASNVQALPEDVVSSIGSPTEASYQHATALLGRIPPGIQDRARSVDHVIPLILGLLLSSDPQVRSRQLSDLAGLYGQPVADACAQEASVLSTLDPLLRLPLAELGFSALRHRTEPEQREALNAIYALIHADGRISVFEYCLSAMLHEHLYQHMHPKPHWHSERRPLRKSAAEAASLLAVLAQAGGPDPGPAYAEGFAIAFPGQQPAAYVPPPRGVLELESGWHALRELNPEGKEQLVRACVAVIGHDRQMSVSELELLRTVCSILQCPLPALAR
ncbi:M48 family metallopeptidase [Allorhizocola rhizosphaerae]|uniref:M48 family metallopeptidase n=1 Tax=Allorhizocola rhizosphaerae TaxID=1872709 RepID=UPI000E3E1235|nr:M48 family metallopeptidase [Allorhizocola rhizosphaerae]